MVCRDWVPHYTSAHCISPSSRLKNHCTTPKESKVNSSQCSPGDLDLLSLRLFPHLVRLHFLQWPPKFNRRRAVFVLGKIDEIPAWEQRKEMERETKFVELGRYLCGVRAGQYWRLESLKCVDEFLERRFPESRRQAYYLMSIHEHLPAGH